MPNNIIASTALDRAIVGFLAHQRALGRGYGNVEYILDSLRRFVPQESAADPDRALFDRWCDRFRKLSANTQRGRQLLVRELVEHEPCQLRVRAAKFG